MLDDLEKVGYGTAYERMLLNGMLMRFVNAFCLRSVLEYPATELLGDGRILYDGIEVLTERAKTYPNGLKKYDLVWNFCSIEETDKPDRLLSEMIRLAAKSILIVGQNIFNPGVPLHRIYHNFRGLRWDHGNLGYMNRVYAIDLVERRGLTVLEKGYFDAPVFVLDLYESSSLLRRRSVGNQAYNKMLLSRSPFEEMPRLFKPIFNHHWYLLCRK